MPSPDHIVELNIGRGALAECFPTDEEGAFTVPGVYDLPLGASVAVRVGFEGTPCGTFLDAVVHSRWPASASAKAGLGLRILPGSLGAAEFVRGWASGTREANGRREWRYPVDFPVILVTAPRGSTRIYPCSLCDVSMRGARALINHRIEPGTELRCEWRTDLGSGVATSRAAWGGGGRLGVEHAFANADERTSWEQLVHAVRASLRARVVAPKADNAKLSAGGIPAVRAERGFTPTPSRATSPSGQNRIVTAKLVEIPAAAGPRAKKRDPRSE